MSCPFNNHQENSASAAELKEIIFSYSLYEDNLKGLGKSSETPTETLVSGLLLHTLTLLREGGGGAEK
jgi:hypothetical protein